MRQSRKQKIKIKRRKKSVNKNASVLFWLMAIQTRLAGGNSESQHEIYRLLIKGKIILALSRRSHFWDPKLVTSQKFGYISYSLESRGQSRR